MINNLFWYFSVRGLESFNKLGPVSGLAPAQAQAPAVMSQ